MRGLLWVILLFAVAVALTVGARYNSGYVLLVLHPYRIELSLNLLVASLLAAFVVLYGFVRVVVRTLQLPSEVRAFRERRSLERARAALFDGLRAFLEGRYARAEKSAANALERPDLTGFAAVLAARSAHELRAYERRDAYLARLANFGEDDQIMRTMAQAELLLEERRVPEAQEVLARLPRRHTAALRLELRAAQMAKQWERVAELVGQLERTGVYEPGQAAELRRHAIAESLNRKSADPAGLKDVWQRLGADERRDPMIAAAAARSFLALGGGREAQALIEAALEKHWDGELVQLYGECAGTDTVRQIERAEAWLRDHPQDATLLLALGRLCRQQQLWGKARSYFEASLSLEQTFTIHMELARLLEGMGEADAARDHYRRSLELAVGQVRAATGGRRRAAR